MDAELRAKIKYIDAHKSPYILGYFVEVAYNRRDPETGGRETYSFPYLFDTCMDAFKFAEQQAKKDYKDERVRLRSDFGSLPYISVDSDIYWGTVATYNIWEYSQQDEDYYHILERTPNI